MTSIVLPKNPDTASDFWPSRNLFFDFGLLKTSVNGFGELIFNIDTKRLRTPMKRGFLTELPD